MADTRGWQPIETAPRDGTEFLACWAKGGTHAIVAWTEGMGWTDANSDDGFLVPPTHWQDLPAPPEDDK